MANLIVKDGAAATKYLQAQGAGTDADPFVVSNNPRTILDVTLTLDTNIYASGDVLSDTAEIASAVLSNGGIAKLVSVTILDEDAQSGALDLVFLDSNVSLGTKNAAVDITDANARKVLGIIEVAAEDYVSLVGSTVASKTGINLMLKAAAAATSLYVSAISRDAKTYTAAGIRLKIGIERG